MMGLAWISVTNISGTAVPVRVEDIFQVVPANTGSRIDFKDRTREPLFVTESPNAIYTAIDGLWSDWLTALGDPI